MQAVSTHDHRELRDAWELCETVPGFADAPSALAESAPAWRTAIVPGTVAEAMRREGTLDIDRAPDFDASDWWYRCRFELSDAAQGAEHVLRFDGLATLAEVWLNGAHVLSSDDMFVSHEVSVGPLLARENEIHIRFRSLRSALERRRPRSRWRTKLVEHQQLRWVRTTLLGRMPGWSPAVRAVGPWRGVSLETRRVLDVVSGDVHGRVDRDAGPVAEAALVLRELAGDVTSAILVVGGRIEPLSIDREAPDRVALRGTLRAPDAELWWPHTHGWQPLHDARVIVDTSMGEVEIDLGRIAFRAVESIASDGGFALRVNGVNVFSRGACWTTPDLVTLGADESTYRQLLTRARDAGMNMLRVGGTMVYESDTFYDLCDELGILVWQDFMFANMDYPADDPAFAATVRHEAENVLARLARHPSLVVLCGNSEVEQQAAMLGHGRELWTNSLFRDVLRAAVTSHVPDAAYVRGSPSAERSEGALPFHVDTGVAHYYGVGAYLRPLDDARRSNVRFASECLGFSNVPEQAAVDALLPNGESPVHHPKWKSRVPRDHGAGWDFEDVRDHYLALLFGVDPMRLRYAEMERYLALSRVITGEVMARTIGEWRRAGSTCHGALVWFYQDLWLGAGWGVLDASGRPKAAYYALKRAMQPVALSITDEGANGLDVHVTNDGAEPLHGTLRLALYRGGRTQVASASSAVTIEARGTTRVRADAVLGRFHDVAYAYRFGAPGHDLVVASLDVAGSRIGDAFHFPAGLPSARSEDVGLSADAVRIDENVVAITVRAERFAQHVALDTGEYVPDDNHFHLEPGTERTVLARATVTGKSPRFDGMAQALNAHEGVRIALVAGAPEGDVSDVSDVVLAKALHDFAEKKTA